MRRFKLWLARRLLPIGSGYRIVRHIEESEIGIQSILTMKYIDAPDDTYLSIRGRFTGPAQAEPLAERGGE